MNKVAFITGGSRGIGKAVAFSLLQAGYDCSIIAKQQERLEKTVAELKVKFPQRKILFYSIDVSSEDAVIQSFEETLKIFGSIDVVFNNAGIFNVGSLDLTNDELLKMLNVNYFGAVNVARVALKQFKKQNNGYLINLSSVCGKVGFAGISGYTASKFALVGLNDSLYHEYADTGIKVSVICPSWVDTDAVKDPPFPREEMIRPDDIAKTVNYLLSLSKNACPKEIVVECLKSPL